MIEYTNKYCNVLNKDGYMGNNTAHVFIYNIFSKYCNGSFLREDNKIITTKYFRQSLFTYFSAFILYAFKIGGNKIWLRQHIFRPFVAVFFVDVGKVGKSSKIKIELLLLPEKLS